MTVNTGLAMSMAGEPLSASLPSQHLLAVGENKRSGLILCKSHYAEFAGPGAAIGSPGEQAYTAVIAIGSPEIVELAGYEDRQKAYSRRIQWVRWLHKIVAQPEPTQRIEKLLSGFEEFFGNDILRQIPNDILALLSGVLPQTIALMRSQTNAPKFAAQALSANGPVVIIERQSLSIPGGRSASHQRHSLKLALDQFPRSA